MKTGYGRTKEVLDACLSSESPEVRAKVYEIINLSGLEPDDPMFLVLALRTSVEADRLTNNNILKVLIERLGQTTGGLEATSREFDRSYLAIKRLQQDTVWVKFTDWFSPLTALVVVALVGFGSGCWVTWLKYNGSLDVLGRNLVNWNIDRILKCQDDKNPKCTLWIVPPERRP